MKICKSLKTIQGLLLLNLQNTKTRKYIDNKEITNWLLKLSFKFNLLVPIQIVAYIAGIKKTNAMGCSNFQGRC